MRKYLIMLMLVLLCTYALHAKAEEGNVTVTLPENVTLEFTCEKVADWKNGSFLLKEAFAESGVDLNALQHARDMQEAVQRLTKFSKKTNVMQTSKSGRIEMKGLEKGMYLIEPVENKHYYAQAMLVTVPYCDEETGTVSYDISIEPKVTEIAKSVKTGDVNPGKMILVSFLVSFLLIIILFLQRFFEKKFRKRVL